MIITFYHKKKKLMKLFLAKDFNGFIFNRGDGDHVRADSMRCGKNNIHLLFFNVKFILNEQDCSFKIKGQG